MAFNKKIKRNFIIFFICAIVAWLVVEILAYFLLIHEEKNFFMASDSRYPTVQIGKTLFNVVVAKTNEERARGLGGVSKLNDHEGMLFVFDRPDFYEFWMKDMLIPIDIIFIDENKKITSIFSNVLPNSFPKTYAPSTPALYVFEISSKIAEKNDFKVGQSVEISL